MSDLSLTIKIGAASTKFTFATPALLEDLKNRYAGYSNGVLPDYHACVTFTDTLTIESETVSLSTTPEGWTASRRDFECTCIGHKLEIRMLESMYAFDACIRTVFATILPAQDSLLVHASAVVDKGRAFLFPGVSGTGKTTIARMSGQRRILNDEIVVLSITEKSVLASGTPFWGEMGTGPAHNDYYPLPAIYFPVQDTENRLINCPHSEAVSRLLRCTCSFSNDTAMADRILSCVVKVLSSCTCYFLHFRYDSSFWEGLSRHS